MSDKERLEFHVLKYYTREAKRINELKKFGKLYRDYRINFKYSVGLSARRSFDLVQLSHDYFSTRNDGVK